MPLLLPPRNASSGSSYFIASSEDNRNKAIAKYVKPTIEKSKTAV
jgi:hypothetical protein